MNATTKPDLPAGALEAFLQGYLICVLFTENDETTPSGGEPLDANYDISDFHPDAIKQAGEECEEFIRANLKDLEFVTLRPTHYTWQRAGNDFWLTRNRHGAGYWDRDLGEQGDRLTDAAHAAKECDGYLGSDGKIHFQ